MKLGEALQELQQATASAFTQVNSAVKELLEAARTSNLTGLGNSMAFEADFEEIQRSGIDYCLVFGDLNGFKQINDNHSHEAGDVALSRAGSALRMVADSWGATAYHKSGDEFVILAPRVRKQGLITELTRQFRQVSLRFEDSVLEFSGSFGCVDIDELDRLGALQRAEEACRIAKRSGRDHVVHEWSPDDAINEVVRRFRCHCGVAWQCVLSGEHQHEEILVCPVCSSETAVTSAINNETST